MFSCASSLLPLPYIHPNILASVSEGVVGMALLQGVVAALEVECHSCHLVPTHPWS